MSQAKTNDAEFRRMLIDLGIDPDEDYSDIEQPEDISATPREQWEDCTRITPPAPILRYLASGDTLTNHTIDMMELAIEKAYGVSDPWYITSMRDGSEETNDLSVRFFSLRRE